MPRCPCLPSEGGEIRLGERGRTIRALIRVKAALPGGEAGELRLQDGNPLLQARHQIRPII